MTFLPLVERELCVASRHRVTYWLRIVAALVAMILGLGFASLTLVGMFPFSTANLGKGLFSVLTWIGLAAALFSGPFLTSDCLSSEKRDGTLGLLFLTDLRGYDVVLGKLVATALRASYALLAMLPVLALTFTMGGVSSAQFGKTALALATALFVSLAAGQLASSFSREASRALVVSLAILTLLVFGGPLVDLAWAASFRLPFIPALSWSSPGYLFLSALGGIPGPFWMGFFANHIVGWSLLAGAGFVLRRTWQEKGQKPRGWFLTEALRWVPARFKSNTEFRRRALDWNPVSWLICRRRWEPRVAWGISCVVGVTLAAFLLMDSLVLSNPSPVWSAWGSGSSGLTLLLYLAVAARAVRFHVEAKRSGLLELILTTPLSDREVVRGQWRGLLRIFGPPLLLCIAFQTIGEYIQQQKTWDEVNAIAQGASRSGTTNGVNLAGSATTNSPGRSGSVSATNVGFPGITSPASWLPVTTAVLGAVAVVANLFALIWYGMWRGLISRGTNSATLTSLLYAQVIPWFMIMFVVGVTVPLIAFTQIPALQGAGGSMNMQAWMAWIPFLLISAVGLLSLIKDVAFAVYAREKLLGQFRQRASQIGSTSAAATHEPPPVLSSVTLPPATPAS